MNAPSLRDFSWRRFLRGPDAELLEGLYVPALRAAVRYDRCCAYFSSTVLAAAARGFAGLIARLLDDAPQGPAVRLLVNEQLAQEDVDALLYRGDTEALSRKLLRGLTQPADALSRRRLEMLAWLVGKGWLEARVALMREGGGVAHAKYGLFSDAQGDRVAFFGSGNETGAALTRNYEEFVVFCGWQEPEEVAYYAERFETLWRGEDPNLVTVSLPEAVLHKLISFAPPEPPEGEPTDLETPRAAMLWRFIAASPYLPQGAYACDATALVTPWPHQRRMVEETSAAFPEGRLLCDEVGMGKTVEAILVLRRLLGGRGVRRALILVPAGLLRQWQAELREKGGLCVPVWENGQLRHTDRHTEPCEPAKALAEQALLLVSREWARLPGNRDIVLAAPPWDLVLMDEAHAARRRSSEEGDFNAGNLLLTLLRELQLRGQAQGILLLSATPMQTQPWEPWDLLSVLGAGGRWCAGFEDIRSYYGGVADLAAGRAVEGAQAGKIVNLVSTDACFPSLPDGTSASESGAVRQRLLFPHGSSEAIETAEWLRRGAPLGRQMHRNTRETLREYHRLGLLAAPPPFRQVEDVVFSYQDARETSVYSDIKKYIERRFGELEHEKPGKGFVMTVYRRRMASSPCALRVSLQKRLDKLKRLVHAHTPAATTALEEDDNIADRYELDPDLDILLDPALPSDPEVARQEAADITALLEQLRALGNVDSKRDRFWDVLDEVLSDNRRVLVFTEYGDTMRYVRRSLQAYYGERVGCYSGDGGEVLKGERWEFVPKADITERLRTGDLSILVCTDAASEGLNLQAASAVINYDLPWNPSRVEQRIGRVDRIGQQRAQVQVRNMFLQDSVDMRVYTVLKQRCGLFEHFVGHMQPVLARARAALIDLRTETQPEAIIDELERLASTQAKDALSVNVFVEARAEEKLQPPAPATLEDIREALHRLEALGGQVSARAGKSEDTWHIRGLGRRPRRIAVASEALESNPELEPLTCLSTLVTELAEALPANDLLPLVVERAERGAFCCAEARFITEDAIVPVATVQQLRTLLELWDGASPDPALIVRARHGAAQAAWKRLAELERCTKDRLRKALERQVESARLRLLRELARTLACQGDDLNAVYESLVAREGQRPSRYTMALNRLKGFPRWTSEDIRQAKEYANALRAPQRQARVAGSEIDAALNDPRWAALEALKSVTTTAPAAAAALGGLGCGALDVTPRPRLESR